MSIQIGFPAPTFTLNDARGEPISLSDFLGQWVILYFYPKDNTPGCNKEACGFRDRYDAFTAQNIKVLGVSPDGELSHQKFIRKFDLPFTLLCDPDATVAKAYESYGPKQFMGKSYEGVLRQTFVIDPKGNLAKIYRKVKPEPHAQELLGDIAELMGTAG
ncbi:thioredoxin-dependent thiol peroxidase [Altericista sp. CCNU0014]|uniref:thioredoxin-dependent thiol peroxidase n=1 Tax=Altericista sp. CCNU0014 TaxID=3082949 RepID=UPI00384F311F